jgi:hypothetical protein
MTSLSKDIIKKIDMLFADIQERPEAAQILNAILNKGRVSDSERTALNLLKLSKGNLSQLKLYLNYLDQEKQLSERHFAAKLANDLYNSKITFGEFVAFYPNETRDYEIEELFDLVEHEPGVGGIFGISGKNKEWYMIKIKLLIESLENKIS